MPLISGVAFLEGGLFLSISRDREREGEGGGEVGRERGSVVEHSRAKGCTVLC